MTFPTLPLGTSDFKSLIEQGHYYIDKTPFIDDIIKGAAITLLPRPRRFGKTLNMSMLNYFFNREGDHRHLFDGLAIEKNEQVMSHFGQYPVIYLSFKDVKENRFENAIKNISLLMQDLYILNKPLLESSAISCEDKAYFRTLCQGSLDTVVLAAGIKKLSQFLAAHYKKNVVILIDEYDMPINSAYTHGYYDELVGFLRNLLSGAFKDNPYLFKGVMTGILRIARESIFSGLNNIEVCALTDQDFNHYLGFTEKETEVLLNEYQLGHLLPDVRSWYNGYNFGGITIYNPWSMLHFVKKRGELKPYWLNTSDNALVRDLIARASPHVKQALERLMVDDMAVLNKPLQEHIAFRDIHHDDNALWNFLLFSGYLRYSNKQMDDLGQTTVDFSIPNQEVRYFYMTAVIDWFNSHKAPHIPEIAQILKYLLEADFDAFAETFEQLVEDCFSYFDVTGSAAESFYHAFVLSMLVQLRSTHRVQSNRESGYGRYDVCLLPHDITKPGFVFEFKNVSHRRSETLATACDAALEQINTRRYIAELQSLGITTAYPLAVAFDGKKVQVKVGVGKA
jgi:hypothetical protein